MLNSLHQIALMGTDRAPELPAMPDWMPAPPEGADKAAVFLHLLSMGRAAERAGRRSQPIPDLVLPQLLEETQPFCSPLAVKLWRDIVELEGKFPVFEQQWLALCAYREQVLAPELLVEIFHYCTPKRMATLRPLVARVTGTRGRWLAQQNEKWKFALATNYTETWRTGKPAERAEALQAARQLERPTAAQMLRETWEKEVHAERKKTVETLLADFDAQDEDLLTYLLHTILQKPGHNKTLALQETKRLLVGMLLALPESALAREWTALLQPYFETGTLQLPSTDDAFFHPDRMVNLLGFGPNVPIEIWFEQLLPIVPPSIWQAAAGNAPEAAFGLIFDKKYQQNIRKPAILEHLMASTLRARNAEWAEVLLFRGSPTQTIEMMAVLPPARREMLMITGAFSPAIQQLAWGSAALHFPWSLEFSHWALRELYQSWVGYFFTKVQQIMPLDVFLHPDTRPDSIPGLYDKQDCRERWLQQVVPELERTLAVRKVFAHYN
jgi:hypothetical protein